MAKTSKPHAKKAAKAVPPKKRSKGKTEAVEVATATATTAAEPAARDPRLPPVGAVMKRTFKGTEYAVTALESGFEFNGKTYRSLSKIAREITGTSWNGFGFFALLAKPEQVEVKS
jgi:hypothetical protein